MMGVRRGLLLASLAGIAVVSFVNLADLYVGKVALEDLELVRHIPDLRPAIILP